MRTDFPQRVRAIDHAWIPLSDGARLGARIWLPEEAKRNPVPAVLEYIPYRKGDATASRDATIHPYFAGHGYACVRVDIRGSGESEGILEDEYLLQEQDDALEVLGWIAAQPWSSGRVGMFGKSWGGFNGLQVAARRPVELAAVITVCSTDDRYADDVHYVGGCVLASDMLVWASTMLAYNARPPDPAIVGERWRELWLERMEQTPPFVEAWLSHQRRDAYWKHGSVGDDYAAIACPIYAVGGWADGYSNAIPRLLAGLRVPRKGLIGPWGHTYPHLGEPGPAIGFLQECLRWWDHWLKGIDTGIMDEPMLRVWMQEWVEPRSCYPERPGRWVAEPAWPPPDATRTVLHVSDGRLAASPGPEREHRIAGAQLSGLDSGVWCPWGRPEDFPPDQRAEDGLALAFTSEPLPKRLEILGFPEIEVVLAVDRPRALVCARLCDVAPTGQSLLVSRGLLNLTHRESHEEPEPLVPGERYLVRIRLDAIAHAFPVGHRIRLAISPSYWPFAWPSPEPVTLTLFTGLHSRLHLPERDSRPEDEQLRPFQEPDSPPPLRAESLSSPSSRLELRRDFATGGAELVWDVDFFGSVRLLDSGLEYREQSRHVYTIVEGDPLSASVRSDWTVEVGRETWQTRVQTQSAMTADRDRFLVTNALEGYERNNRVFVKTWTAAIPRDLA